MTRRNRPRPSRRRGVAPVEFVMQLPFLLALAAMIYTVGNAAIGQFLSSTAARREVWEMRDRLGEANNELKQIQVVPDTPLGSGLNLSVSGSEQGGYSASDQGAGDAGGFELFNPELGRVYGETEVNVRVFPWLGGDREANSGAAVLATSWDHRDLPEFMQRGPHLRPLERAATGTTVISPVIEKIARILLYGDLSNQVAAAGGDELQNARDQADDAQQQADEKADDAAGQKEELQKQIDQKKKEKQELEKQRDALQQEKSEKQAQLEELMKEDPPNQQAIDELNEEIDDLNKEISQKNKEIQQKQKEIDNLQENMDEVDQHQGDIGGKVNDAKSKGGS